ncbi:osmotically inducible lipoprotein E [Klebsiella pneumoniae]|uniref:Osmotically inducible lipoprotein E n=1 Tax=Klebsiella pneumoniae TaxID=573 RepID=A0A377TTD2_KLEPN|nr:osmotically inducible lipoprotein E [Klebsiella pneumoniae]
MNKSLAGILGVTVALTLLAGCTAYDRTKDQFTQAGGERCEERDVASAGDADRRQTFNGSHHGPCPRTCQTYILGQRDGKVETYFVALDETGHVMNSGYQTCAEYDTDPRNAR